MKLNGKWLLSESERVLCYRKLLICGDTIDFHPAVGGTYQTFFADSLFVCRRIYFYAYLLETFADPCPHVGGVFSYPSGKHQRIESAENRRISADVFFYPVVEDIQRKFRALIADKRLLAHVANIV